MDLAYTSDEEGFRAEVKTFIATVPEGIREKASKGHKVNQEDITAVHKLLHAKGWEVPGWPAGHGGRDWSSMQHHIFQEEMALAGVPTPSPFGVSMVGPVICQFGNDAQKAEFLPKIRSCDMWWCQGFSEPNSGSDLASLKTRAVRDGNHFIVNGQKTWTSFAHWADWIFCLVRTDPDVKQQEGISFLLFDMKTPGITIRPIVTLEGGQEVNEVFFEDVRVPVENLVGEENKGWTYAKFLLSNERTGIARVGLSKFYLRNLKVIAKAEQQDGKPLIEDPDFRRKVAEFEMELMGLEMTNLRVIAGNDGGPTPMDLAGILKIRGSDIQQRVTELIFEAVGPSAIPYQLEALTEGWNEDILGPDYSAGAAPTYFNWRKTSIYGGTNEIQRNIISKMMLS
jgi:alkylation response protein AidB-like acyl-CoA dehydrogenase